MTGFAEVAGWERLPDPLKHRDVAAVDVDAADRVYLFTRYDGQVLVYEPDGTFVRAWGAGVFTTPHGLTVGPDGRVWCVDAGDHSVRAFTPEGDLRLTLGVPGTPSDTGYDGAAPVRVHGVERVRYPGPPFNRCTNLAFGPDGDVYVADGYGNCRVHRFDPAGRLRGSWGEVGTGPGQFHLPHGIAVAGDGRVLVADRENDRIQVFDPDGGYIEEWTGVRRPCDLAVAADGRVYVAELWRPAGTRSFVDGPVEQDRPGRVSVLDGGGAVLDRWTGAGFVAPHGIAVDSRGDVYVAEVTYSFGIRPGRVPADRAGQQLRKFVRAETAAKGLGHEA
ncbi:peptidyl-alpha-hydroxyglycine alpha-amidating lyase family protein [Phytohabitans sp. ZYX-F-186]|uniref:Peptidyl-alpha-hydroxyglycine alpha-amidating lyase family protein n=1 Tax=Phytohabitans maris TaxID=3071409 RepID=A0ABU0ZUH6_9ACTN|nr:peptidyl-alpha-hydroxyglycine alpha-amidating lyase family protein [Phytohabitans sp. ZYX-F-186]MDQ7910142.1 peptidyl-alpha-hydroxyglycine alpha-amidating lyase family protein [Phytohabitans sp. ZYX-F-186]